ncbi:hypothetical protein MNBD_GAMMA26-1035, partial [hydrothermal vent metagenome]
NHGTNGIGPAIASNNNGATIAYVDQLDVSNGTLVLTTTGSDGSSNMVVTMMPILHTGAIEWELSGTGCDTAGRSIKCTGN